MNPDTQSKNHTALIVVCITVIACLSGCSATFLLWKGFQSGELFVQVAAAGVTGLLGFLGGKSMSSMTTTNIPEKVKISNTAEQPVAVHDSGAPTPEKP